MSCSQTKWRSACRGYVEFHNIASFDSCSGLMVHKVAIFPIDYYRGLRWQALSLVCRPFVWKYFAWNVLCFKIPRIGPIVFSWILWQRSLFFLNKTKLKIDLYSVTVCLCFRFLVSYRLLICVFSFDSVSANQQIWLFVTGLFQLCSICTSRMV